MSILKRLTDEEAAAYIQEVAHDAPVVDRTDDPNAGTYADMSKDDNVGDVNSTARGSGARFVAGKPKLEHIPMDVLRRVVNPERGSDLYMVALQVASFERRESDHAAALALAHVPEKHRWASTAEQFDFGAKKYAPFNWAKGMVWSIPLACIKRHWLALARGEETDPESGVSHWGAIGCNLVMLIHYETFYKEGDDRPPTWAFGGDK